MNLVYRVVFNAVTGIWHAVSEIAKGPGKSSRRAKRVQGAAAVRRYAGLLLVAALSSLGSAAAWACTPYPPLNNDTVSCSSAYWLGFASSSANLTITVNAGSSIVQTSGGGGAAMLASGGHLLLTNSGTIDPSGLVAMPVLTSGVIAGNGSASSIIIQSDNNGIIRGTARSPTPFLTTLAGTAVEVWNAVGGQTRINNAGRIESRDIAGLSTPTVAADNAVMVIRGGGQVIMSNVASGVIVGRIAFERSSGLGNTFLNAGIIRGSLSMGAGGVNEFTAVTIGSLTGDGSTAGSLGNSLGYNLVFAPTGQVDGGAGGVNTLKLRNPSSAGNSGASTISADQYVNFNYLEVNGGTWTINGPLLRAASTSTTLAAGTAIVDNSLVFGNGSVQANGGALQSSGANVNLANSIIMNSSGLTVTGGDDLTLSGVISGASGTLRKSGGGGLTLNRANTYSGMTYLDAGTLILGHNNALGSSTLIVGGGGLEASTAITVSNGIFVSSPAMTVGGSNDITLTGLVNIGAKLVKDGTSNLTLGSSTMFSGGAELKGGTLTVDSGSALGSGRLTVSSASSLASSQSVTLDNPVTLNSNLTVNGSNDLQLDGVVSGSGKLIKAGAGMLTLNAVNTHTGGVELQGGTLRLDAYGLGSGGLKVSGDSTLEVGTTLIYVGPVAVDANLKLVQPSNTVLAGILSGSGTITKTGISTLRLDNTDSTFSGAYDIQQGFLTNNAVNALGVSPNVNLAGGAVLNVSASGTVGALTGPGSVAINGIANLTVGGNNQSSTFSGAFSGGGGLVKAGAGTLTLSSTSTHSGGTQVNGGTLNLSGRLTSSTVTVNSGGTLRSTGQLDGGAIVRGGGALALAGGTAGAVQVQPGGSLLANAGAPVTTGELFISNGGILTFGLGQIASTPIINVQGNLTLDGIILNFTDAGGISNGVHRLMNYSGTLTYRGHILGSLPTGVASNQMLLTLGAGQVNLLVSSPSLPMQFWDGNNTTASGAVEGGSGTWNSSLGNWTNALGSNNWAWASQGAIFQGAAGTVTVDAAQSVSFMQFMTDGYRVVSGSNGSLSLNPGGSSSTEVRVDAGVTAALELSLGGGSRLDKVGTGTLVLTGNNGYYGGTRLAGGTLRVGHTNAMGSGQVEVLDGTTLGTSTALSLGNSMAFSGASTLDVDHDLALTGSLSGNGSVTKNGSGTLTLTSNGSSLSGALTLSDGALTLTRSSALGTAALIAGGNTSLTTTSAFALGNSVMLNGNLTLPGNYDLDLSGVVSGAGTLIKQGSSTLTLSGNNLMTGTFELDSGTLRLGHDRALGQGGLRVVGGATLDSNAARTLGNAVALEAQLTIAGTHDLTLDGAVSGSGGLVKNGSGKLTLTGTNLYTGNTTVNDGTLRVDGSLGSSTVAVASGATLTGHGTVGGAVSVADGGHLSLSAGSVLRLGALELNNASHIDVALATAVSGAAGLANVSGDLTLDGRLNISDTGGFGFGVYRLFDYGGLLTNHGLEFGSLPTGAQAIDLQLQTGVARQVNLVVGGDASVRFWDGAGPFNDGVVAGGSGVWNSSSAGWSSVNGGFNHAWNDSFAVFQGTAGMVTVEGTQRVTGMQFAGDGYHLVADAGVGGQLDLINNGSGYAVIRVDSGNTATLDVVLGGSGTLAKLDSGTLVLNGNNSYSGGTRLGGGALVVGHNNALGSGGLQVSGTSTLQSNASVTLGNAVTLDAALTLPGSNDLALTGPIDGAHGLIKTGSANLALRGDNSYSGGTQLGAGTLELGHHNALGTGALQIAGAAHLDTDRSLTVSNNLQLDAALTLDGSHDLTLGGAINGSGDLIKEGTGTVTLTGTNSATGGTMIAGGRLVASVGSLASGAITNHAALELNQASDATLTQAISGSGSFTKAGAGTLTLAGANTSTGDTVISAGRLVASVATLASGSITNHAALELNQTSDATLTQAISGSGSFTKTGAGTLTLAGANTSTGDTFVSAGRLVASVANLASGAITNNAALELKQASDATLAQKISGSGSLTKTGAGVLTLAGNSSSYTGSTQVTSGSLLLGSTGQLGGTVTVASGATLAGTGTVGSAGTTTTVQSGAVITAGDASTAYGTLHVAGDLKLEQGATYQVKADPNAASSSLIQVAGMAALAGSVLHVGTESNAATDFQVGQTYTILHAGQINGTFSAAASNYAYLNVGLDYLKTNGTTTDVTLTLARNDIAFASQAQTPNQAAAANAIESLGYSHPLYRYVQSLANGAPAGVFANTSGDSHAGLKSSLVGLGAFAPSVSGQHLRNSMTAGMRPGAAVAQSDGPLPASAWPSSKALPAWAEVVGHWQRYDGDGNAAQLKQRTTGLFLGMDQEVGTSGWRLGGSVGYTNADGRVADRSSESDVNSYSAAVYGGKSFGTGTGPRINVLGGLAYTWHDIETTRRVSSLGQTLKADYSAHTAQLFAEVGYAIGQYDKFGFEPFAGVSLGQQRTGSFQEHGGFAALNGRSSTDDLASTTLGMRVHSDFQLAGKEGRLRATVGWRHAFGDVTAKKTMAFEGGQNFTVAGTPLARNTAVLGLEADVALSRSAALVLGYQGEMGSGQRDHSANVKLRWAF